MKDFPGIYRRGRLYHYAIQREGTRKFFALETDDLTEAIRRATVIRDSPVMSRDPVLTEVERFLSWKKERGHFTEASIQSKGTVLRMFARHIGDLPPHRITGAQINDFYREISKGRASSTANSYMMMLRSFFEWAVKVRRCSRENPVAKVELFRGGGGARTDFCSMELRDKLLAECDREDLRFVLYCGFHAGLRFNEIVEARPFWFDLPGKILHLRKHEGIQFKDREERAIPMSKVFHAFIEGYGLCEPYMLRPERKKGKSLYRYDFGRPFQEYMERQGVPWVTPHVMRHTFASLLASKGRSIYLIAEWLGDDVRVVQKHYARLLPVHDQIEL